MDVMDWDGFLWFDMVIGMVGMGVDVVREEGESFRWESIRCIRECRELIDSKNGYGY